jgi:hypothetical protein
VGVRDGEDLEDALDAAVLAERAVQSRPTSMRVTRYPPASKASAQALPELSDTGRSLDQPPISTATCLAMTPPPAAPTIATKLVKKR